MKRRTLLTIHSFLILISLYSLGLNGQLKVNILPRDTTYCIGLYFEPFALGSELEVENVQGSYVVSWECDIPITSNISVTASRLFVDTTVFDPVFKDVRWDDWSKIKVNVKDSINNIASDSVNIRFSKFGYSVHYAETSLALSDSILFDIDYVNGGIKPLKYEYFPKDGLSNPFSLVTWVKPESTTLYSQQITDSCGCISLIHPALKVNIENTDISTTKGLKYFNIRMFQNYLQFDNPNYEETLIYIYNLNGELIYIDKLKSDFIDVNLMKNNPSIIFVKVIRGNLVDIQKLKIKS